MKSKEKSSKVIPFKQTKNKHPAIIKWPDSHIVRFSNMTWLKRQHFGFPIEEEE